MATHSPAPLYAVSWPAPLGAVSVSPSSLAQPLHRDRSLGAFLAVSAIRVSFCCWLSVHGDILLTELGTHGNQGSDLHSHGQSLYSAIQVIAPAPSV